MNTDFQDILKIPGNKSVYEDLKLSISSSRPIAFLGAGCSVDLYPNWTKSISLLADFAVASGKASSNDAAPWKRDPSSTLQQRIDNMVRKLRQPLYHNFLRKTFGPVRGSDGRKFTATHELVLRLGFKGYVTTNYDPGLEFARAQIRPDSLSTGTPTWRDEDEIYRWRTGDIFEHEDCPALWIHGYWQRPETIVLNSGSYAQAYKQGIYRDTFHELWIREQMVFVGFGFADPQFTFMVGEFLRDLTATHPPPRHFAFLGWPADGGIDLQALEEKRASLEADYHLRPFFYPVRANDHSTLTGVLKNLSQESGTQAGTSVEQKSEKQTSSLSKKPQAVASRWVHETTNDSKFIGRDAEIECLNRWVRDEAVRLVAISAIGGTGKTALVGHWLKNTHDWNSRSFAGLFAWSFYQNRDIDSLLRTLIEWAGTTIGTASPPEKVNLLDNALELLRRKPCILVLDGLEILQEGPDQARYGSFIDRDLREFLVSLAHHEHRSVLVLTSRFSFADLDRYLGTAFHQLEMHGLTRENGATLLSELGVRGRQKDRQEIASRLEGHPLGLRVFAEAIPEQDSAAPLRFIDIAFSPKDLPQHAPLSEKLKRLFVFYQKKLVPLQVQLLSVISLFRSPVDNAAILRLIRGLYGNESITKTQVAKEVEMLQSRGVLTREPLNDDYGSACHPILRDYFRSLLIDEGISTARRAADLLKGTPSARQPRTIKDLESLILAIELLLDAGDFKAADDLYRNRLRNGNLLIQLPACPEGFALAYRFVSNTERRHQCSTQLSPQRLAFYLGETGQFANLAGYYEGALSHDQETLSLSESLNHRFGQWHVLLEMATSLVALGRLTDAIQAIEKAHLVPFDKKLENRYRSGSYAWRCWCNALMGRLDTAAEDFFRAQSDIDDCEPLDEENLTGRELRLAEFLFLVRNFEQATTLLERILKRCRAAKLNGYAGWCYLLMCQISLAQNAVADAESHWKKAEAILRRGQVLYWFARSLVCAGKISLARRKVPAALEHAREALALAGPRGMTLVQAEALLLRGRARLFEGKSDSSVRALDDASEARRLANVCSSPWIERDACLLQAELIWPTGSRYTAKDARADAEYLTERLLISKKSLAQIADRISNPEPN